MATTSQAAGDFALEWGTVDADLFLESDDLGSERGIRTAVLLSLFLDCRAEVDDKLPGNNPDRRGWWGNEFLDVQGDQYGSKFWLRLERGKLTPDLPALLEQDARDATAWLIEDRVASRIDVTVTIVKPQVRVRGLVHRPAGKPVEFRFDHVWRGEEERAA